MFMTSRQVNVISHTCLPFRIHWGDLRSTDVPESLTQLFWDGAQVLISIYLYIYIFNAGGTLTGRKADGSGPKGISSFPLHPPCSVTDVFSFLGEVPNNHIPFALVSPAHPQWTATAIKNPPHLVISELKFSEMFKENPPHPNICDIDESGNGF